MIKEVSKLISTLTEINFKEYIKEYIKSKYKTTQVRIIDGPYDGGNDLEIILTNDKELKKNIQITVQKVNYDKKLIQDIKKAQENVLNHNYLNSLDFYINQNISKESRNQLEQMAEIDYGINLKIIDSNILSEEITNYDNLIPFLYNLHDIKIETSINFDKKSKIVFDVLTHNKNSVEIKKNFINSYIYSYLFTNPNSSLDEIFDYINPILYDSLDKVYFEKELNHLRLKQLIKSGNDKTKFFLSDEKEKEISKLYNAVENEELVFIGEIEIYLKENKLEISVDELIAFLYKIYQDNYTIDIEEIKQTNNSFSTSLRKSLKDLNNFLISKGIDESLASQTSKKLLNICSSNDFLTKLSTVYLFNNLYNSNKLEKYINSKEQKIIIDTQILIRLLCVLATKNYNFEDSAINSVKILYETLKKYEKNIYLQTTYDYIEEVSNHLIEAIKLRKFMELPYIKKLGNSKNVFYNNFLELKKNGYLSDEDDFLKYVSELVNINYLDLANDDIDNISTVMQKKIAEIFDIFGFDIIYHESYINFQKTKREYEISLTHAAKFRSHKAIQNDLRTIIYLSTKESHLDENGAHEEPYLITWDSAFYSIRHKLNNMSNNEYSFWYIYSPLKFVDRISVMNFNLNPDSINLNIIALTESNFNYSSKNASFLDVISSFFNKEDVSELTIISKLANLQTETRESNEEKHVDEFNERENDDILLSLLISIRNYFASESKYQFNEIIKTFEVKENEDQIIQIISTAIRDNDLTKMHQEFENMITANE